MYTPRRRRVGPRGAASWPGVPRRIHVGPARNLNPLFIYLFILKHFKSKIKLEKSLKIIKFITFKI